MKRFVKYLGLLLGAFLLLSSLISLTGFYALRKSNFYKPSFLANGVTEQKFDYIVLGSSVGLTTLDTKLMDSLMGTTGINLSMDDTGLSSQYLMLEHFLAEGKKTDYVILAPGIAALENKDVTFGDNDYRFLMYGNRNYIHEYYKNATGNSEAATVASYTGWMPFLGMAYYNMELFFPSLNALLNPSKRNRFDDRGNYSYPKNNKRLKDKSTKTIELDFKHPYLEKIQNLCEKNNIKLVYYFAPTRTTLVEYKKPNFQVIDHSQTIKDASLFYDDIHVNNVGRNDITRRFVIDLRKLMEL